MYEQHVRGAGGDDSDPRNAIWLARECHAAHHAAWPRLPASVLRDETIAFAAELLGPAAYDYFVRRYSGAADERRIAALLTPPAGSSGNQDGGGR